MLGDYVMSRYGPKAYRKADHFRLLRALRLLCWYTSEMDGFDMLWRVRERLLLDMRLMESEIDDLPLSVRSLNCLFNANILLIGDLMLKTERDLLKIKNFGRKSLLEVRSLLALKGLTLKGKINEIT